MSRRIDIELTSNRNDGTWTWRAAGAKAPKGVLDASVLTSNARTGDVLKVEADFDLDGITVLSVVNVKEKGHRGTLLEVHVNEKEFVPVTQKLVEKGKSDRKPRGDSKGPRRDGANAGPRTPRPPRTPGDDRSDPRRTRRPSFVAPPELPKRPAAKRLKPKRTHRTAVLAALPEEQRGVAERALDGGIKAVRDAVKTQNDQLRKDGKPEVPAEGLISMAQELLPKLRVADWLDKAEAAKADIEHLDLRDLRSVVVASDDPMVVRDETTRVLAADLKLALKAKQESEQALWLSDIAAAINVSRIVRALKISSEPPKAGQPFPAELGAKLAAAAATSMSNEKAPDRWIAVVEAVAFSPIRAQVKPTAVPETPGDALLATVKRVASLVPHIATMFGVTATAGAASPRPLRPTRPIRQKPKSAIKPPAAPAVASGAPAVETAAEPTLVPVVDSVSDATTESIVEPPTSS
jgi:hypothetical protein